MHRTCTAYKTLKTEKRSSEQSPVRRGRRAARKNSKHALGSALLPAPPRALPHLGFTTGAHSMLHHEHGTLRACHECAPSCGSCGKGNGPSRICRALLQCAKRRGVGAGEGDSVALVNVTLLSSIMWRCLMPRARLERMVPSRRGHV